MMILILFREKLKQAPTSMYKQLDSTKRLLLFKLNFKRPCNKHVLSMRMSIDLYYSDSSKAVKILDTAFYTAKHFILIFQYLLLSIILLDKLFDFPHKELFLSTLEQRTENHSVKKA